MLIPHLTFVIFTYNEAGRLPKAIRNFQNYGPILVVDNYSTDETVTIARSAGCEVLMNQNKGWVEDFETTESVKSVVKTDWIYWGFADEIVSYNALLAMKQAIETDRCDIIAIMRKNYFYAQFCYEVAATYQTKAFKKHAIDFRENTIHNFGTPVVTPDRIYRIPPDKFVHHLISNTVDSYLGTIIRYTAMEAASKPSAELDRPVHYYLLMPLKMLWQDFFRKGGRKTGQAALSLSTLMLIYSLTKAMKGYEKHHGLDAEAIKSQYQILTDQLLAEFE